MKKRVMVLCSVLMVLALAACRQGAGATEGEGIVSPTATTVPIEEKEPTAVPLEQNKPTDVPKEENKPTDIPEKEQQQESISKQALTEFQEEIRLDGSLCAVAFLSCQPDGFAEVYSWLENAEFLTDYPFLEDVTEKNTVLAAGEEWYVVVPADNQVTLTINEVRLDETEYTLKAGKELLQVSNGELVLLRGNISDIMPNLMVTATGSSGEMIEYCPALSLRDGRLVSGEGVYDFTCYDWFMEAEPGFVAPMQVYKADTVLEEWKDNILLSSGEYSVLRLGEEAAAKYPNLSDTLAEKTEKDLDTLKHSVETLKQYAEGDNRENYFSDCYTIVQRADEKVFSVRHKFYEYTGGMHPNNYTMGLNFDPESGSSFTLKDIISDTTVLLPMIEERLFEKYPAETFFEEKGCVLDNYAIENLQWTLGYQGITFYFSPYDISAYVYGTLSATIWFDEVPELFYKEYTYAPEQGHAFSFFINEDVEFDRNLSDGQRDVLSVSRDAAEEKQYQNISICFNEEVYRETEFSFQDMTPYLVCNGKPGEENYFLYLYLVQDAQRILCIYNLNGEEINRTEVVYNVLFDGFWATEAGNEVYYEKLLLNSFEY